MTAGFTVVVTLDEDVVAFESKRRGRDFRTTLAEILGDVECRLVDAIRWRDAVTNVAVEHRRSCELADADPRVPMAADGGVADPCR